MSTRNDHSNAGQRKKVEFFLQMFTTLVSGGFLTWALGSYFTAKTDQQKQLDNFVGSFSKLVIENNLYRNKAGNSSTPPPIPIRPAATSAAIVGPEKEQAIYRQPMLSGEDTSLVKPESFVAQAYVINTLQAFDGPFILKDNRKKEIVLKFLYGFQLLGYCDNNIPPTKCFPSKIPLDLADLDGVDFKNVSKRLAGINLSSVKLRNANLHEIILPYAKFNNSELQGANFSKSDLSGAKFKGAFLQNADFKGAIIDRTNFNGAMLCGADFSDAIIQGSTFDGAYIDNKTILPPAITEPTDAKVSRPQREPCFEP